MEVLELLGELKEVRVSALPELQQTGLHECDELFTEEEVGLFLQSSREATVNGHPFINETWG
jgi:hypothetical protein